MWLVFTRWGFGACGCKVNHDSPAASEPLAALVAEGLLLEPSLRLQHFTDSTERMGVAAEVKAHEIVGKLKQVLLAGSPVHILPDRDDGVLHLAVLLRHLPDGLPRGEREKLCWYFQCPYPLVSSTVSVSDAALSLSEVLGRGG
jgi:hypothetical protein